MRLLTHSLVLCQFFILLVATPVIRGAASSLPDGLYAEISTPRGTLVAELFYQQAPLTVSNFVGLAEGSLGTKPGVRFFDGLKFHRVVPNFVIQGGDPLGTGEGDPGYKFQDEFAPGLHHNRAGILSMANAGPDTNGSQFFITLRDTTRLNYLHSVFGRLISGLDLIDQMKKDDPMKIRILRVGTKASAFQVTPQSFALLQAKAPMYSGPEEPGPSAPFDDPDKLLPQDPPRSKNFNFKLANFERSTGIKVRVRVLSQTPPALRTTMQAAHNLLSQQAQSLGLGDNDALALFVADQGQWFFHVGKNLLPRLVPAESSPRGKFAELAAQAQKKSDQLASDAQRLYRTPPPQVSAFSLQSFSLSDLPPALRLKITLDAMIDLLLLSFAP